MTKSHFKTGFVFLFGSALSFGSWAALAAPLSGRISDAYDSGESIRIVSPQTKIISHQEKLYHGWASLAKGGNGRLYLVYSGGREYHVCPFGRVEFMVSNDGGATWSWPRVVADSLTDDRDAGIMVTSSGSLLVSFYTSVAYQQHLNSPDRLLANVYGGKLEEALARWRTAEAGATQEERRSDVGYWLIRSTDQGRTWSSRYRAPGYNPHGPIALTDGRIFYAASDGKKAVAWASEDDGMTWQRLGDMNVRPGEMHSVEAADGTLIVHVRDRVPTGDKEKWGTVQIESRDGGKKWSERRLVTDGYPPHLLRLKDDVLLLTYGSRIAPFGIRGKISRDHGASWSKEFFITDDAPNWDHGYPTTAQLDDGSLITIWYETPAEGFHARLRQAKWTL